MKKRITGKRNPMIYGQFIEHFHRQIYDGIHDPSHPLADEDGLRTDILDAMRRIKVPVLRWPGGCFVSSYHWKDAADRRESLCSTRHGEWRIPIPLELTNISGSAGKWDVSPTSAPMPAPELRRR